MFHELWTNSDVLCLECRVRKPTALTKADLPRSRLGPLRYVLHANFSARLRRRQAATVRSDDGRGEDLQAIRRDDRSSGDATLTVVEMADEAGRANAGLFWAALTF